MREEGKKNGATTVRGYEKIVEHRVIDRTLTAQDIEPP
jgi:hypothetical protein